MSQLQNPNPIIYNISEVPRREARKSTTNDEDDSPERIDSLEVFDLIRNINDPEHPLTLEQLKVAQYENVFCDDEKNHVKINFTPTIPHCSMATLIGLCIRTKLTRSLPPRFKIDIQVTPGTHASEDAGLYREREIFLFRE